MQETGKTNLTNKRKDIQDLSIQYSLSGLSFYRHDTKALVAVEVCGGVDAAALIASETENGACHFEKTTLLVYTNRFVAVPNDIYDATYDNDYLFAKNIVCEEGETVVHTSSCNISFLTVVESALLKSIRLTAISSEMVHPLQYLLEAGAWRAEKSKKGMLFLSVFNDVVSYAFFKKRKLQAFDSIAGCDFNALISILGLLNQQFDIDKVISVFDEKELLPLALKRHSKKVETTTMESFFTQKY